MIAPIVNQNYLYNKLLIRTEKMVRNKWQWNMLIIPFKLFDKSVNCKTKLLQLKLAKLYILFELNIKHVFF